MIYTHYTKHSDLFFTGNSHSRDNSDDDNDNMEDIREYRGGGVDGGGDEFRVVSTSSMRSDGGV